MLNIRFPLSLPRVSPAAVLTSHMFAAAMCQAQALRDLQAGCEVTKLGTPATWHDYVEKHACAYL